MNRHRGETWGNAVLFALMTTLALTAVILLTGCSTANPVAPTPVVGAQAPAPAAQTSRVLTWPDGLWLEHNPAAPGVQVCVTQPRVYCHATEDRCFDPILDYYTVLAPETCPAEPIE